MYNTIVTIIGFSLFLIYFIALYNDNIKIKKYKNDYLKSKIPVIIEKFVKFNISKSKLYIRNISNKSIKGIQLSFYYRNNWNEIVEVYSLKLDTYLENTYDKQIILISKYIGKSDTVVVEEILFTDNTIWKSKSLISYEEEFNCYSLEELIQLNQILKTKLKYNH